MANNGSAQKDPVEESGWADVREAQFQTLSRPNTGLSTGMAVTIDIGDPSNVCPKDKFDVGHRLALASNHAAYGGALYGASPLYYSMVVKGNEAILTFEHYRTGFGPADTGGGLMMGAPPWTPTGTPPATPTTLTGFAIAGADKQWHWGNAVINKDTVVVTSDQVPAPVAVRYGWADNPSCNLYSSAGFPATPFRTDTETPSSPAQ